MLFLPLTDKTIVHNFPSVYSRFVHSYLEHQFKETMRNSDLNTLDEKITSLVNLCRALMEENLALRQQAQGWKVEHDKVLENNELALEKVEAMIKQLKTMEGVQ